MPFHLVFILGTKVQSIKAHLMTQVTVTLTQSQGQINPKLSQILIMGHISDAISPKDLILGTKVQPNEACSITGYSNIDQRSRQKVMVKCSQNMLKTKELTISLM